MKLHRLALAALLALTFALPASAQNRTRFGGRVNALDFAYGIVAGAAPLTVAPGVSTAATTATVLLNTGWTTLGDGTTIFPLATNAPIIIGTGANQETVTPTAVSGCTIYGIELQCNVTATFTKAHAGGDSIFSGTMGLQEAVNYANASGGGIVDIDGRWGLAGGTNAIIATVAPTSNVNLEDTRNPPMKFWSAQPSTLTTIAAPVPMTAATVVYTATPVGTWAASATYFCWTYVDMLGGESACSTTYNQTPTLNYTLTVPTPPAASTGAVGWRMYAGITSVALAYLLPIDSTHCTLTTLENVMPACAMNSGGTWSAAYLTTTALSPVALGVTNTDNPVPQSHTTFAYEPTAGFPVPFQTHYGPFGSGTIASATAADVTMLGTVQLPAGYLNQIGRTIRLTGKIVGGDTATGTMSILIGLGWVAGDTAGLPVTVCNPVSLSVLGTQNYSFSFSCTLTTNAVGATAIGSLQPDSWFIAGGAAGTTNVVAGEASATAVGSLGLFAQDTLDIYITPATEPLTAARLMDLSVETLQ